MLSETLRVGPHSLSLKSDPVPEIVLVERILIYPGYPGETLIYIIYREPVNFAKVKCMAMTLHHEIFCSLQAVTVFWCFHGKNENATLGFVGKFFATQTLTC